MGKKEEYTDIKIDQEKYVCPECGYEFEKLGDQVGLDISFTKYTGYYCLHCWAKWISENIPKLVKK